MGPQAESACTIIAFPSQGRRAPVNNDPGVPAKRKRRVSRKRMVWTTVDANMVQRLHEKIYLLCTGVSLPPRAFLRDMWAHIEDIRSSVDEAEARGL